MPSDSRTARGMTTWNLGETVPISMLTPIDRRLVKRGYILPQFQVELELALWIEGSLPNGRDKPPPCCATRRRRPSATASPLDCWPAAQNETNDRRRVAPVHLKPYLAARSVVGFTKSPFFGGLRGWTAHSPSQRLRPL